jgi:hypothetical protein
LLIFRGYRPSINGVCDNSFGCRVNKNIKELGVDFSKLKKRYKLTGAFAALSLIAVPVIVQADASNPIFAPKPKKKAVKAKASKPRAAVKSVARKPAPRPVVNEQAAVSFSAPNPVAAPAPVFTPPPAPAPVFAAPAAPVAAAPVAAAVKGGSNWLLAALAAAAIVGGIVVGADNQADTPTSP